MDRLHIVFTTVPTEEKGVEIARLLVAEKLAACVNLLPGVRSFYVWDGKPQDEREFLLVAKVPTARVAAYRERMAAIHPYEVPEIAAVEVASVNEPYARWCLETTGVV